jgi:hypothetical protein
MATAPAHADFVGLRTVSGQRRLQEIIIGWRGWRLEYSVIVVVIPTRICAIVRT